MTQSFHEVKSGPRLLGYVAIDSTVAGRARGGLRIVPDLSPDEIRCGARAMTLKYGLLGLPQGGAKAGILGDADATADDKRRLLREFARAAGPLLDERVYVPEADLGTTANDIRWMMAANGMRIGPREWKPNHSGEYTARSCLASAVAVMQRRGAALRGSTAAIEGFGKVGSALALRLHARGAVVVAVSTSRGALYRPDGLDVHRLAQRAAARGSAFVEDEPDRIERSALLELPVDLLFPCARFRSIDGNAARVRARAICAGANDPVSPEGEAVLLERAVVFPPDFLTNCGGVLGGTLEFAGVPVDEAGAFVEAHVGRRVAALLDRAERERMTPRVVAEEEALARHAAIQAQIASPSLLERLVSVGVEAHRRRWVPKTLVSRLATLYLARRFGS